MGYHSLGDSTPFLGGWLADHLRNPRPATWSFRSSEPSGVSVDRILKGGTKVSGTSNGGILNLMRLCKPYPYSLYRWVDFGYLKSLVILKWY